MNRYSLVVVSLTGTLGVLALFPQSARGHTGDDCMAICTNGLSNTVSDPVCTNLSDADGWDTGCRSFCETFCGDEPSIHRCSCDKNIIADECMSAVPAGTNVDTCNMTRDAGEPDGSCWTGDLAGGIAWYTFTADDSIMRLRTDVKCDGTDSEFAVYPSCAEANPGSEIACSEDDAGTCSDWLGDICVPTTSGTDYVVTLTQWTTGACGNYALDVSTGGSVCGDGIIACDGSEDCDDPDMGDCEHGCRDCACMPPPVPMLPAAGLVGLGVLLITGGALVFSRRRK